MTAALLQTHRLFADALAKFASGPLCADFVEFARPHWPRVEFALSLYQFGKPADTLATVKRRVQHELHRERLKVAQGHWSACPNRRATCRQLLALIQQFEAA